MNNGVELIAAERLRQVIREGYTAEHDDQYSDGELAKAAVCYIRTTDGTIWSKSQQPSEYPEPLLWPWSGRWWKPSDDPIRNLVKAGALIAAEIDRLRREQDDVADAQHRLATDEIIPFDQAMQEIEAAQGTKELP